jgi:uncharacterized protein (DUF1015 family)
LFIADGHHRYEAALRYRSLIRSGREVGPDESINYRMVLLVSVDEPGLITRGYHRSIQQPTEQELGELKRLLHSLCDLEPWVPPAGLKDSTTEESRQSIALAFADALGNREGSEVVFGVIGLEEGSFHIASAKNLAPAGDLLEDSEYSRLHDLVINPAIEKNRRDDVLDVQHDLARVLEFVQTGESAIAFAMRPVPMKEFIGIVTRGWRLPPKATNFFPKPSAGTVLQTLEGDL